MNEASWITYSTHLPESDVTFVVEPVERDAPMGSQLLMIRWGLASYLTVTLTADQADQLEHELERARWHRVFKLRELLTVVRNPDGSETVSKPDDDHSGGWTATIPAPATEQEPPQ